MRKINYEIVKNNFEKYGYQLLEDKYVRGNVLMEFICDKGHRSKMCWSNFNRGRRCAICGYEKIAKSNRLPYDYVKTYFEEHGCILLDTSYRNAASKLRYLCSCGGEAITIWSRFSSKCSKHRCRVCWKKAHSQKIRNPDRELVKLNKVMAIKCNSMVRNVLKGFKKAKNSNSFEFLGYTTSQLRDHLTSHPDWYKIKNERWSIDHIFPIKAFIDHNITDLKLINCLDNLRPMLLLDNISKHAKYDEQEFIEWLKRHGN